jgi:hemolysin activation/secretion protein
LIGPYFHYNKNTGEGITGRYIFRPTAKERYYYKISKSANVNEEYLAEYTNQKFYLENASFSALADIFSDGTSRFYGLGRRTQSDDQMNYTHREQTFQLKAGYFINKFADISLGFEYLHIGVKRGVDDTIDQVVEEFKDDPLIRTGEYINSKFEVGLNLLGELDEREATLRLSFWGKQGLSLLGEDELYEKWGVNAKFNWNFHPKLSWAGSINYQELHGKDLPFYMLSSMGGSRSFRGYELGRFYDKNSFLGMTELRWKFGTLNKFNFTTVWELAFFYDMGQVGNKYSDFALNHLEHSGGIGIRTHFGENILTRIDLAIGNEGFKVYVDFGYPF